jgi:hypothetical protein
MTELRSTQAAIAASSAPALAERVSWGAVVAGAVIALAVLTVLNLIGLAMGLYAVDASDENLGAGLASGLTGIWWAISSLIALFVGGWVAGKLAGNPNTLVSGIHGAAVWAGATLLAIFTVTSAMSAAFTGAAGIVGRAAQTAATAANTLPAQNVNIDVMQPIINLGGDALANQLIQSGVTIDQDQLREESRRAISEGISASERQELQQLAQQAAGAAVQDPTAADQQLRAFAQRAFGATGVIGADDRAQIAASLSERTGVPEAQVRATLDAWQAQYATGPGLEAQVAQLRAQMAQSTEETAGAVAGAALWTALGLILALVAAVAGGILGRPMTASIPAERVPSSGRHATTP